MLFAKSKVDRRFMIAASVLVHESMDCVLDLVENINYYAPEIFVVLHVSKEFHSFDEKKLSSCKNVFVNSKRNVTSYRNGLLVHHVSNFLFLRKAINFSHFLLLSSNEMLIKHGLENHIRKHKNGFQATFRHQRPTWHLFNRFQQPGHKWGDQGPNDFDFVKNPEYITLQSDCPDNCPDQKVATLMREVGFREIIGGQAEGQFYESEVFEKVSEIYERIWGPESFVSGYETEEFIPMMVAKKILKDRREKQSAPITLVNYTQPILFDKNFLEKVRKNDEKLNLTDLSNPSHLCTAHLPPTLYCPNHEDWSNSSYIYSLKRIPRIYDDPTRSLIRSYYK